MNEIDRAQAKLKNESFVKKAPAKVIEEEKEKIIKYTDMLAKIEDRIKSFKV